MIKKLVIIINSVNKNIRDQIIDQMVPLYSLNKNLKVMIPDWSSKHLETSSSTQGFKNDQKQVDLKKKDC